MKARLFFYFVVVALVNVVAFPVFAWVIDQELWWRCGLSEGSRQIHAFMPIGQSFTPSKSSHVGVALYLEDLNPGAPDLDVSVTIREETINGPAVPGATAAVDIPPGIDGGVFFPFESPVFLHPGATYVIDVATSTTRWGWHHTEGHCYTDGIAYQYGEPHPLGDFWFRTWVEMVWSEPVNIGPPINATVREYGARLTQDMLTMFFVSRDRPGGYGGSDIWVSTRNSIGAPWSEPVNLGPPINTAYHDLFACPSFDELILYFDSDRPGGYGDEDIYVSTRDSIGAPWSEPVNLGPPINTSYCDCQLALAYWDMSTMYFCSDRPGGYGDGDIWMSTRDSIGAPWNNRANLGPPINTQYGEWNLTISPNGLTLFFDSEDRPGGYGGSDIWISTRDSIGAPWSEPVNPDPPINTEYGEYTPWICSDGVTLYFCSDRPGGHGGEDLWMSRRVFNCPFAIYNSTAYTVSRVFVTISGADRTLRNCVVTGNPPGCPIPLCIASDDTVVINWGICCFAPGDAVEFTVDCDYPCDSLVIADVETTFTAFELSSFTATAYDEYVELNWTTAAEIDNAGFNVHRGLSKEGPYAQINDQLIPARGSAIEGARYSFTDEDVAEGITYYYWLEDVDIYGRGSMHGPVSATPGPSSVEGKQEVPVPTSFSLAQNYPNPFNPITEITYALPTDCHVRLGIYNLLGQQVTVLVDERQTAGLKAVTWDGSSFASGVYLYRLHAGDYEIVRRMVLLR